MSKTIQNETTRLTVRMIFVGVMMRIWAVFLCVFLLAACAVPKRSNQIWSDLAMQDIQAGKSPRTLVQLRQGSGINVTDAQLIIYLGYYKRFIREYCSPDTAYLHGVQGIPENKVCMREGPKGWLYHYNWQEGQSWESTFQPFVEPKTFGFFELFGGGASP